MVQNKWRMSQLEFPSVKEYIMNLLQNKSNKNEYTIRPRSLDQIYYIDWFKPTCMYSTYNLLMMVRSHLQR